MDKHVDEICEGNSCQKKISFGFSKTHIATVDLFMLSSIIAIR